MDPARQLFFLGSLIEFSDRIRLALRIEWEVALAHLALYREWRPQTFDEVVAQEQVVFPLKQAVIKGDIGHAYLFSGTRGTGKTSLAKIFAKAVNCKNPQNGNPCNQCSICEGINNGSLLDVMEIDAASNNSVDNIRRITDEIVFTPSEARYKVYIIDEVHMLSQGAFNALLKTLEEPPAHAIFILATTEAHRIPATILSRCQRYEFRRIPLEDIVARLARIASENNMQVSDEALRTIARLGDGALRDAISLLDQCRSGIEGEITHDGVLSLVGIVQDEFMAEFACSFFSHDLSSVLLSIDHLQMSGRNLPRFIQDFCAYLRNILLCRATRHPADLLNVSTAELNVLMDLARQVTSRRLIDSINALSKLQSELRWAGDVRTALELELISLMSQSADDDFAEAGVTEWREPERPVQTEPVKTAPPIQEVQPAKSPPIQETASVELPQPVEPVEVQPEVVEEIAEEHQEEKSTEDSWDPFSFLNEEEEKEEESKDQAFEVLELEEPEDEDAEEEEVPLPEEPAEYPEEAGFDLPEPDSDEPEAVEKPAPPVAPVAKEEATQPAAAKEPVELPQEKADAGLWDRCLQYLREQFRIDLVMLLRPAQVFDNGKLLRILFPENLTAHCHTVRKQENRQVLRQALLKAGHGTGDMQIDLEGEIQLEDKAELGKELSSYDPEKYPWLPPLAVRNAQKLGIPIEIVSEDGEEGPTTGFNLEEDDELPF